NDIFLGAYSVFSYICNDRLRREGAFYFYGYRVATELLFFFTMLLLNKRCRMKKITLLTLLALVLSAPICTASILRVKVNTYGELADAVGDRLNDIDSIWVEGSIDSTDIRALWNASFHGHARSKGHLV
ncbi:MAG: hypothetical protein ACOCOW_05055, partial [Prevotella sp.]